MDVTSAQIGARQRNRVLVLSRNTTNEPQLAPPPGSCRVSPIWQEHKHVYKKIVIGIHYTPPVSQFLV